MSRRTDEESPGRVSRWSRRRLLSWLAAVGLWPPARGGAPPPAQAQPRPASPSRAAAGALPAGGAVAEPSVQQALAALERAPLERLAEVLLPAELTVGERRRAVADLLAWLRGYRAGAEMDPGYGAPRLHATGPHPAPRYAADLERMRQRAAAEHRVPLERLDDDALRALLADEIDGAAPALEALPGRPDAPHLAIALLSAYYGSPTATDRCYGVAIRRESCRGLFTDVDGLAPFRPEV